MDETRDGRIEALACSFCGAKHAEARKLIAGPIAFACDACVGHAAALFSTQLRS